MTSWNWKTQRLCWTSSEDSECEDELEVDSSLEDSEVKVLPRC